MSMNCISYWLPLIEKIGLPVPRTLLIAMTPDAQRVIWTSEDGEEPDCEALAEWNAFIARLRSACETLGSPVFLRAGETSAKHSWKDSCFVTDFDTIPSHVFTIAKYCEMASALGLPYDVWAVREYLSGESYGVCPIYHDMPLRREYRFFADASGVICRHPYWPQAAIAQGGGPLSGADYAAFARLPEGPELARMDEIAAVAARACGGAWSVDLLDTDRGWVLTDMALAAQSYHWEGCPHNHHPHASKD